MTLEQDLFYIGLAIEHAYRGVSQNEGGPFGAVVVKDNAVIASGNNKVVSTNDPTAHAEMVAIKEACQYLNSYQLAGCTVYSSCEPCPMCLGALYWARPDRIVYACTREDAAAINFDDDFIYKEILHQPNQRKIPTQQCGRELGLEVFKFWMDKPDKIHY